jgi:methylmalonyl-CoA mutase
VIPPQDHAALLDAGVAAVYGPGTNIPVAAAEVLKLIAERQSRVATAPAAAS